MVTLVIPNEPTPAYAYQVLEGRLYNRSKAGSRFGYRLELPTNVKPLIPGLTLHLAEIHLTIGGLQLRRRGRKPLFWTRVPECPASRKVSFGADYAFAGGQRSRAAGGSAAGGSSAVPPCRARAASPARPDSGQT